MAGAYLTKKVRQQIIASNWNMVIGEIQSTLVLAENQPRLKKQLPLLKAAEAWDSEGVYQAARKLCKLCKLSRKVPPGTYYQSAKSFKFSGQRVTLPKNDATWSLGLVHPQIYR